ncbi:hypothetical protein [Streptomyces sp. R41]|uniref:Phage holin family protein n=1 Tax=Streptomyces sp. R41 TaxID=3238632 RepID=A0AB39RIM4_9ACTN
MTTSPGGSEAESQGGSEAGSQAVARAGSGAVARAAGKSKVTGELKLERDRALFGLIAVGLSNVVIAAIAGVAVWQLNGDKSVALGVISAAFTAVSTMTTAYLGIKAVSNTAKAMSQRDTSPRDQA